MAKSFLTLIFFLSLEANADLFDFGNEKANRESKIPALIEKLKNLEIKEASGFEEEFNLSVKSLENGVEQEKLYCTGEAQDQEGRTLPAKQRQLCMRELKKDYIEATSVIFEIKKKYLSFIHEKQLKNLSEIQKKLKSDIEKNF